MSMIKRKREEEDCDSGSNKKYIECVYEKVLVSSNDVKPRFKRYASDILDEGIVVKERVSAGGTSFISEKKVKYGEPVVSIPMIAEDGPSEQLRGMALFYSTYAFRPDLFAGNPWDDNTELHLRILLSVIRANNLVHDDVVLLRNVGNTHPGVVKRPQYITDKVYEMSSRYEGSVLAMEKSFLSGTGIIGVYNAFRKFAQEHIKVSVDVGEFSIAYMRFHIMLDAPDVYLPGLNVSSLMDFIKLPNRSKSGYRHNVSYVIETDSNDVSIVRPTYANSCRVDTKYIAVQDILGIYRDFSRGKRDCKSFGVPVHVTSQKVEPREPSMWESDRHKTRNFTIAPEPKMSIDYILARQYHVHLNRRCSVSIGLKWKDNGASHLARKFCALDKDKYFYVMFDFSGLDYTLKESIIALLAAESSYYFHPDQPDYDFYCWLSAMSAAYTATKHVAWYGKTYKKKSNEYVVSKHICRLTRGCLCSGEYQTSSIDSRYVVLVIMCFDEWICQQLRCGKRYEYHYDGVKYSVDFSEYDITYWMEQFNVVRHKDFTVRNFVPREVYGDDGLLAYNYGFEDMMCNNHKGRKLPTLLMHYIETRFYMVPKMSEVYVLSWRDHEYPFLTTVCKDVMVYSGVKFLQRRFIMVTVDGKHIVAPWRETSSYYTKATTRAENLDKPEIYLAILRGLILDTMGTNSVAYSYLSELEREVMKHFPMVDKKLNAMLRGYDDSYGPEDWVQRIKRLGFDDPFMLGVHMSQDSIRKLFVSSNVHEGYVEFCMQSTYTPTLF